MGEHGWRRAVGLMGLAAIALTACAPERIAGSPRVPDGPVVVTTPVTSGAECTDIVHGDPWIVFASPLQDGAELAVGDRGYLPGGRSADQVDVRGTPGAVRLSDERADTTIECGVPTASAHWLEVTAVAAGTVTLTVPGSEWTLHLTIVDR